MTLAHAARPYLLAGALAEAGYEVSFASSGQYRGLFGGGDFAWLDLKTISTERFLRSLKQGSPLYDLKTLRGYVQEDRERIQAVRPDLVLSDFRLSLCVSAQLEGVPCLNITNGYWHPSAQLAVPCPSLNFRRWVPNWLADLLFQASYPLAFRLHCEAFNRLAREFSVDIRFADIREVYTWGDVTVFADLPGIIPHVDLPEHCEYLGPLLWSPALEEPDWWGQWDAAQPLLYLNLGSSGPAHLLNRLIQWTLDQGWQVLVGSGGEGRLDPAWRRHPKVFHATYLPGERAAEAADVVVCNGGSPTVYQAFVQGRPVIGIAENLDQYLNMEAVEPLNASMRIRSDAVGAGALVEALGWSQSEAVKESAIAARNRIEVCRPQARTVEIVHGLLGNA